jgi:uncharacterized phage-associated protein
MRFILNRKKAAQAAAFLVKKHGGKMNLMVLLKLLYLADRTSLIQSGVPITGDTMVSMPHGPVLSQIYDSMKMPMDGDPWCDYLSERNGYDIDLVKEAPEDDELSRYEIGILSDVHKNYGHLQWFEIRKLTHDLPEWTDPNGGSLVIDPAEILRAEGKTEAEIERISRTADEIFRLKQVLYNASAAY